jgi:Cell division protein FtsI/penicillin-binding protein 2
MEPVTEETAETIKELLIRVVESPNGTAHVLNNAPLTLGAKTGTAEFQRDESEDDNDINGFLYAFDAEESSFSSIIFIENESGSSVAEQFAPIISQHE